MSEPQNTELAYGDYTLKDGEIWITIGNISVHVRHSADQGRVYLKAYPLGLEDRDIVLAEDFASMAIAQEAIDDDWEGVAA